MTRQAVGLIFQPQRLHDPFDILLIRIHSSSIGSTILSIHIENRNKIIILEYKPDLSPEDHQRLFFQSEDLLPVHGFFTSPDVGRSKPPSM